jgi:hypothetical protein
MADSDDEYDRKRRDKFRGERAEATYRGAERVARPRDDWAERDSWSRPRPREYRPGVRDRGYSPSLDPAPKRLRHDYYADSYYNHYTPYHQSTHRAGNFFREPPPSSQSEGQQPPMMSFKAFLATQDDNISDSEAIEKYNDYKLEFQRQQLNEFFVAHKDDEWFRLKYHPEDSVKRKEEQMAALKKRVEVFLELMNSGKLAVTVDCIKTGDLLKLLDTVVIKLEGGTDEDLAILEQEYTELEEKSKEQKKEEGSEKVNDDSAKKEQQEPEKPKCEEVETKENGESGDTAAEDGEIEQDKVEENPPPEENKEPEKMDVDDEKKEEPETNEPPKEKEAVEGEEEVKKNQKGKVVISGCQDFY